MYKGQLFAGWYFLGENECKIEHGDVKVVKVAFSWMLQTVAFISWKSAINLHSFAKWPKFAWASKAYKKVIKGKVMTKLFKQPIKPQDIKFL